MRKSKYFNKKTIYDGIKFDSIKEKNRYIQLKELVKQGQITNLILQPKIKLQESFKYKNKTIRAIVYIADFSYIDIKTNTKVIEDVKGVKTDVFNLKYKLLLKHLNNINENIEFKII